LAAMSTIVLTVREEAAYVPPTVAAPPTFGGRVAAAFGDSVGWLRWIGEWLGVGLVAVAPWVPPAAAGGRRVRGGGRGGVGPPGPRRRAPPPPTFGGRVAAAFGDSVGWLRWIGEWLVLALVAVAPWLPLAAAGGLLLRWGVRTAMTPPAAKAAP